MHPHRFTLQPYDGSQSRYRCPQCRHRNKTFKRYTDLQTGSYIAEHVGRCDREEKCGYHFTPRQYFANNPDQLPPERTRVCKVAPAREKFNHLPVSLLRDSLVQKAYADNNFVNYLADIFGWETALQAAERYKIGTSKHWHGATVFWQTDAKGRIRTGKIMLYDKVTGKRVKQPFNHIAWVHALVSPKSGVSSPESILTQDSRFKTQDFHLRQCFFGEHLLAAKSRALVGITESEKTAVMASIMMPDMVWLAAGSLHGLNEDKWQSLKNRTVLLFPDVGAYDYWTQCARTLNLKIPTATFAVHNEMESTATTEERANGADMADRWAAEWLEMTR